MTNVIEITDRAKWIRAGQLKGVRDRGGMKGTDGRLIDLAEDFPSETAPREHLRSDNLRLDTMRPVDPGDDAA